MKLEPKVDVRLTKPLAYKIYLFPFSIIEKFSNSIKLNEWPKLIDTIL